MGAPGPHATIVRRPPAGQWLACVQPERDAPSWRSGRLARAVHVLLKIEIFKRRILRSAQGPRRRPRLHLSGFCGALWYKRPVGVGDSKHDSASAVVLVSRSAQCYRHDQPAQCASVPPAEEVQIRKVPSGSDVVFSEPRKSLNRFCTSQSLSCMLALKKHVLAGSVRNEAA